MDLEAALKDAGVTSPFHLLTLKMANRQRTLARMPANDTWNGSQRQGKVWRSSPRDLPRQQRSSDVRTRDGQRKHRSRAESGGR